MTALAITPSSRSPVLWGVLGLAVLGVGMRLAAYAAAGQPWGGLAQAMCHFDCEWYERIARDGYGGDADFADFGSYPHWAFFPLYPLLLRMVGEILPLSARLGGVLLSSLCLTGFIVLGAAYLRRGQAAAQVGLWIAVVLLLPNTHFLSAVYTEALFALASGASLLALARGQPLLAAGLAALAAATRPTGIALAVVIIGERLRFAWRSRRSGDRAGVAAATLLPIAIAPLGLSLYMLAQYLQLGDAMAFSHVQIAWGRVWHGPVAVLSDGLARWDWSLLAGPMAAPSASYAACWALLGLAVAGALAWRQRYGEACFLGLCVLLPASTGLDSLPRFIATNPVFMFATYRLLAPLAWAWQVAALGVLAGAHGVMLFAWMSGAGGVF